MVNTIEGCLYVTIEAGFIPTEPVIAAISNFRAQYPNISFSIKIQSSTKILERLIAGTTSLVFGRADIFRDFANQYNWHPATLHLACSDQTFHQHKNSDLVSFLDLPLVDTNKSLPTLQYLLSTQPELTTILEQKSPSLICRDRTVLEKLLRTEAVGALSIAAQESLPAKVRVLDHLLAPKKVETTFCCRKRSSRDLIETVFLEHIIEYAQMTVKPS